MTKAERLLDLRELFLTAPESGATRVLAIALSVVLVATVFWLVRRRLLREEYTPIWIGVGCAILLVSVRLDILRGVTRAIGAWTVSSTLFFLGQIFLVVICLNYAVRLSRAAIQIKNLAQEVALLKARFDQANGAADPPETSASS